MKQYKKRLLAILICLSMLLGLCACGNTAAVDNSADTAAEETADQTGAESTDEAAAEETDAAAEESSEAGAEEDTTSTAVATAYLGTSGSEDDYFIPVAESVESFETVTVPCYIGDVSNEHDISIGILNGMEDIPYLSLETIADLMTGTFQTFMSDGAPDFLLDVGATTDDNTCFALVRENDATMVVDFVNGLITITDPDLFAADPGSAGGMDIVSTTTNGGNTLFVHTNVYYRTGEALIVDLNHYGILPVVQDGVGYLPLQTVQDLIYSRIGVYLLYDGNEVMVASSIEYPVEDDTLIDEAVEEALDTEGDATGTDEPAAEEETAEVVTEEPEQTLSDLYYASEKGEKSDGLCLFTYNELCLALDYNYGLQTEHNITSFNTFFIESGLKDQLMSSDAGEVYLAIDDLCGNYFADSHSGVNTVSYRTDLDPNGTEATNLLMGHDLNSMVNMMRYSWARDDAYPDGVPGYEEVGDTAYITFDEFYFDDSRDYYSTEITNNMSDTFELIMYANQQISREDSPIKNVVLDLSNNGGGYADCAAAVLSWYLGAATINLADPITGTQSTMIYQFDTNLDGEINAITDSLYKVNKYCIISPNSFSCGNLVPEMLEASDNVTLIGHASNGGACVVEAMTTADGNIFQISGPKRISTVTNGTYYSVDEGVDPDIYISDIHHLYDREYMTNLIDNLP